jgi:arginyl-tRNA synthetase
MELSNFGPVIGTVEQTLEFHRLAGYLHDLATTFSGFYQRCPVLRADPHVRERRLALCDLTARVLHRGLDLLGIAAPDRM